MANNEKLADERGRTIRPVLFNTAKDGSGTWYFPIVDSSGRLILGAGTVTMADTAPVIAATTTLALAANANREYAMFINDSDEVIYIKVGNSAVMNTPIRLNASGGSYEMSRKIGNLDVRVVNGICASGSKVLLVTEGV